MSRHTNAVGFATTQVIKYLEQTHPTSYSGLSLFRCMLMLTLPPSPNKDCSGKLFDHKSPLCGTSRKEEHHSTPVLWPKKTPRHLILFTSNSVYLSKRGNADCTDFAHYAVSLMTPFRSLRDVAHYPISLITTFCELCNFAHYAILRTMRFRSSRDFAHHAILLMTRFVVRLTGSLRSCGCKPFDWL
jgi:hypothetical protein